MGKSLQDQLLAKGVARPKQAKKARREKAARDKAARQQGAATDAPDTAREIAAAEAAKRERDRALNAEQKRRREARERDASVAQLIEGHAVAAQGDADDAVQYNYHIGDAIRRIAVSDRQRRDLAAGRLGIVRHGGRAVLVPREAAERIAALMPEAVWRARPEDDPAPDPDDPYADYPVPDDLMW